MGYAEKYGRASHVTDNVIRCHALCMQNNQGCKHTLRICKTHFFPTATVVSERASVLLMCIHTLPVLLSQTSAFSPTDCCPRRYLTFVVNSLISSNAQNVKAFLCGLRRSRSGFVLASLVSLVVWYRGRSSLC